MAHGAGAVVGLPVKSLIVMGVLGLLTAGFLFLDGYIIKMRGPEAFESIERTYVDFARVNADEDAKRTYESLKRWIMHNEPLLREELSRTKLVGIGFSLLTSVYCFGLASRLRGAALHRAGDAPPP